MTYSQRHSPDADLVPQSIYDNPSTFDGYRFLPNYSEPIGYDDEVPSGQLKQQMVSLDDGYVMFGVGRHAW